MALVRTSSGLLVALWLGIGSVAHAAPDEIQVYMDDMDKPGHFGLDLHNNYVFRGPSADPAFAGGLASARTYRFTPEFSYGITESLEGGLYILSTLAPDGSVLVGGEKLRLKYIAPHPDSQPWYWGANIEVGRVAHQYDQNPWNGELKGIFGYNGKRWTVAVNPNIDWTFSHRVSAPPTLELDTKVAYRVAKDFSVGVESYDQVGELKALGGPGQTHNLYGTIDTKVRSFDLNFGLGWGFTKASDGLAAKAIVGVPFR